MNTKHNKISIIQVDAFTNEPFKGNPAAICILSESCEADWMQNLALELNLSETAFLLKQDDGYNLRWFTPTEEVDLCGHATLASAHVLWEEGFLPLQQEARFFTRSGLLTAIRKDDWIEMDFPSLPVKPDEAPDGMIRALGVQEKFVGFNGLDYLVEVASPESVRALKPDLSILRGLPGRGVMVTSVSDSADYDFISRFFAPSVGIDEDPVTGSAHCCLGPYWAGKLGKTEFVAYQASARGGVVRVRLQGDRVALGGQAVTVLRSELA